MRLIYSAFVIMGSILTLNIVYDCAYDDGFERGADLGITRTLDTVSSMLNAQAKSDSICSKATIAGKDTVTYYLSRRSININKHGR